MWGDGGIVLVVWRDDVAWSNAGYQWELIEWEW